MINAVDPLDPTSAEEADTTPGPYIPAGSKYPLASGRFGVVSLSGTASVQLSPPTTGTHAGIVLFQSRDNAQTSAIGGSAVAKLTGTVYAPAALVEVTGTAEFESGALVVNEIQLQGSGTTNVTTAEVAASPGTPGIVAGPDSDPPPAAGRSASTASSRAIPGPGVTRTNRSGAAVPTPSSVVVWYGPERPFLHRIVCVEASDATAMSTQCLPLFFP